MPVCIRGPESMKEIQKIQLPIGPPEDVVRQWDASLVQPGMGTESLLLGSVDTHAIRDLAVTTAKIEDLAVTNAKIQNLAVDTAKIKDAAITKAKIAEAAIGTAQIENAAITSAKIGTEVVEASHIKAGSINATHIQAASIETAHIQDLAVTDAKIESISANKITAGIINTALVNVYSGDGKLRIVDNALEVWDNQTPAVLRVKLGDISGNGTLYGIKIMAADGTTTMIDDTGVYSAGIKAAAIVEEKIADEAVVTRALRNLAVTTEKIDDLAVTTAKIADASITSAKIAQAAIGQAHIGDAAIGTAQIADLAVTDAKIQNLSGDKIIVKTITSDKISSINADITNITAGAGAVVINDQGLIVNGKILIKSNTGQTVIDGNGINADLINVGILNVDILNLAGWVGIVRPRSDASNLGYVLCHEGGYRHNWAPTWSNIRTFVFDRANPNLYADIIRIEFDLRNNSGLWWTYVYAYVNVSDDQGHSWNSGVYSAKGGFIFGGGRTVICVPVCWAMQSWPTLGNITVRLYIRTSGWNGWGGHAENYYWKITTNDMTANRKVI